MKKIFLGFMLCMMSPLYSVTNFVFFNNTCKNIRVTYSDCAEADMKTKSYGCVHSFSLNANEPAFGGSIKDSFNKISVIIENNKGQTIHSKNFYRITPTKENIGFAIGYQKGKISLTEVPYDTKPQVKKCNV